MSIVGGHVKMMSEYMTETALWTGGDLVYASDLSLTPALGAALDAWQQHFEKYFDYMDGWDTTEARECYRDQAPTLLARLERELPPGTHVEVDLWPLSPD